MDETAKYLIHADITADGVVERSDVVGAVFGQTEGLLGADLDIRDLQQTSKLGRIDVDIESQNGQSYGTITIASSLDKVETAILSAALETITQVGPCRATVSVSRIEDVRAAKRREVVDRAKELLASSFDEDVLSSDEILEEVRESVRVERITEYRGLPAGPRVEDSDAIIVVEGRSDVLTLLQYGVKTAIAVEGTNVPDEIADLTHDRTVTAFLDGDRGGNLILRELSQVADLDYVALAPSGRSVEDLARHEVMTALRGKVAFERVTEESDVTLEAQAATDGSLQPAPEEGTAKNLFDVAEPAETDGPDEIGETNESTETEATDAGQSDEPVTAEDSDDAVNAGESTMAAVVNRPSTLREHVEDVVDADTGMVRLLDDEFGSLAEAAADDTFDALLDADDIPHAVVIDGELTQRVLDVAAQRGVDHVITREEGQFTKQPADVRVRIAADLLD